MIEMWQKELEDNLLASTLVHHQLPTFPIRLLGFNLAICERDDTLAAAQYHSKTCRVSDAAEEKDNAANKTHNGDVGEHGERGGLRRPDHRPGGQRGRGGTEEGWRTVR